jgi:mono/diheme cytochrome c family protein
MARSSWWRPLLASLLLALPLASLPAGPARAQQAVPTPISVLPEGEGRDLVWVHCNICHDLGLVRQQRLDRRLWNGVLDDMKAFGAFFTDEQRQVILEYLLKHFGRGG